MADTATAPPRAKTQQQLDGEGFEKASIAAIDKAADLYVEARDERMQLTKIEKDRKKDLQKLMHEHGQKEYHYEDHDGIPRVVELVSKEETVKVRTERDEAEEDEE